MAKSRLKPGARDPNDPWPRKNQPSAPTLPAAEFPPLNPNATPFTLNEADEPTPATDNGDEQSTPATVNDSNPDDDHSSPSDTPLPIDKITNAISDKIYINDDLTSKRDYLLYVARQSKKRQKISDTWANNGSIRIKDLKGVIHTVNELSDIPNYIEILRQSQK